MTDPQIHIDYIGGNCPVQAEGFIGDKAFYFRARWDKWTFGVGTDPILYPEWIASSPYGETPGAAGWMPQHVALEIIAECISSYCRDQTQPE